MKILSITILHEQQVFLCPSKKQHRRRNEIEPISCIELQACPSFAAAHDKYKQEKQRTDSIDETTIHTRCNMAEILPFVANRDIATGRLVIDELQRAYLRVHVPLDLLGSNDDGRRRRRPLGIGKRTDFGRDLPVGVFIAYRYMSATRLMFDIVEGAYLGVNILVSAVFGENFNMISFGRPPKFTRLDENSSDANVEFTAYLSAATVGYGAAGPRRRVRHHHGTAASRMFDGCCRDHTFRRVLPRRV